MLAPPSWDLPSIELLNRFELCIVHFGVLATSCAICSHLAIDSGNRFELCIIQMQLHLHKTWNPYGQCQKHRNIYSREVSLLLAKHRMACRTSYFRGTRRQKQCSGPVCGAGGAAPKFPIIRGAEGAAAKFSFILRRRRRRGEEN